MKRRAAIYVRRAWAELQCSDAEAMLEGCLSFSHPSPWFSKAYREKRWDGKIRMFSSSGRFPAGLTPRVVEHLQDLERDVFVSGFEDKKALDLEGFTREWLPGIELWDHQWDATCALLKSKRGVVKSPTGCHRYGQRVIRQDGTFVEVQDVRVGDALLGADSFPRRVLGLCRGEDEMFEVRPLRGQPFVVNGDHVLSLVRTKASKEPRVRKRVEYKSCQDHQVVNVTVREWLGWSRWKKHIHKLYAAEEVQFIRTQQDSDRPVDPYFLGVWLGDGTKSLDVVAVTTADAEIESLMRDQARLYGLRVSNHTYGDRCSTWAIVGERKKSNLLLNQMRALFPAGIRIPAAYRTAPASVRRAVLAGLIDSDGHLSSGRFDFVQKSRAIFEDTLFIARSLGLRAREGKPKLVKGSLYYRVSISGALDTIPTRLLRKQAGPRKQVKNPLRVGFNVVPVGREPFYGFQLDCDHLYLLDDFTVTHNSGKTEDIFATASYLWDARSWRSLILEPTKGLMRQTYERARVYFDDWITVGMAGDGERIEGNILIATAQTMQHWKPTRTKRGIQPAEAWLREVLKGYEVLFLDECHRASSPMWYDIAMNSGALCRYGFSGTPIKDSQIDDMKLIGATGPIIFDVGATKLIDQGLAAKPKILMVMSPNASGPSIENEVEDEFEEEVERLRLEAEKKKSRKEPATPSKYRLAYRRGIIRNEIHNRAVVRGAQWMVDQGRKTLLLCRYKEHFNALAEMLEADGTKFIGVWGKTDNSDRDHAKEAMGSGKVSLVLATGIWDEGEDIPGVDGIVLAEGVKATTNSRQRVGRGMRGDTEDVWVLDFVPTCYKTLREHAAQRAEAWEGEEYEVLVWTEWPEDGDVLELPFGRWDEEYGE